MSTPAKHSILESSDDLRERVRLGELIVAMAMLAGFLVGCLATPGRADEDEGYSTSGEPVASHPSWMSVIPDYLDAARTLPVNLTDLSIPGTHDAATATCADDDVITQGFCMTQSMVIGAQLDSGIRGFDIRILYRQNDTPEDTTDDYYTIAHGVVDIYQPGTEEPMDFGDVLDTAVGFLRQNPRETVILMVSDERTSDLHENADDTDYYNQHRTLIQSYVDARRASIWLPEDNPEVQQTNGTVHVPDLWMTRGKIVLFVTGPDGGGIPYHGYAGLFGPWNDTLDRVFVGASDRGEATSGTDASFETRLEGAIEFTHRANTHGNPSIEYPYTLYCNSTAAFGGGLPIAFAGGVGLGLSGLNERFTEWLLFLRRVDVDDVRARDVVGTLGLHLTDFPDGAYIEAIIAHNLRKVLAPGDRGLGDPLINGVPSSVVELVEGELEPMITSFMHHVADDSDANETAGTFGAKMNRILHHFVGGNISPTEGGTLGRALKTMTLRGFADHAIRVDANGLKIESPWVHDTLCYVWTSDGRAPEITDQVDLTRRFVELVVSLPAGAGAHTRRDRIANFVSTNYPGRRMAILVKEVVDEDSGGDESHYVDFSVAGFQWTAIDGGYIHFLALYDKEEEYGDDCENRILVAREGVLFFDNRAMKTHIASFCGATVTRDMWYEWIPSVTGNAFIQVGCNNTNLQNEIAVYALGSCDLGEPIACSTEFVCPQGGTQTTARLGVFANTEYLIRVGTRAGTTTTGGRGTLELFVDPIMCDECADATFIQGDGSFAFDTTYATASAEPQAPACGAGGVGADVWYSWVPESNGYATLSACAESGSLTRATVYEGTCSGAVVGCADLGCGGAAALSFETRVGRPYLIRIATPAGAPHSSGPGSFTISTQSDDNFEQNDTCASASTSFADGTRTLQAMDDDWYAIFIRFGEQIDARILFTHAVANLDLFFYDQCGGSPVGQSATSANEESLTFLNNGVGRVFYLRVVRQSGGPQPTPYQLTLSRTGGVIEDPFEDNDTCVTAVRMEPGSYEDLVVYAAPSEDEDWYRFTVPADGTMDVELLFDHEVADIDAYASLLTPGSCEGVRLGFGSSSDDNESFSLFPLPETHDVVLRVFVNIGRSNTYDMNVRIDDRFDGNDTCMEAADIELGAVAALVVSDAAPDWYSLFIDQDHQMTIDLEVADEGKLLSATLLDACGGAVVAGSVGTVEGRRITFTNTGPGQAFLLLVEPGGGNGGSSGSIDYGMNLRSERRLLDSDGDGVSDADDNCPRLAPISGVYPGAASVSIPDADFPCSSITTGLTQTLTFPQSGLVTDLKVILNIQHGFVDDLDLTLEHDGTAVKLLRFDSEGRHFISANLGGFYVFDDGAGEDLSGAAYGCWIEQPECVVEPGSYRPTPGQALAAFDGMDAQGEWILRIHDTCPLNTGFLTSWALDLRLAPNPDQTDTDGDGVGDICEEVDIEPPPLFQFRRGECNDDGTIDISDAVCLLSWLFLGAAEPGCTAAMNLNGDSNADISDAVSLLNYLFVGGPAPAEPFADCGAGTLDVDVTMGCERPPPSCR